MFKKLMDFIEFQGKYIENVYVYDYICEKCGSDELTEFGYGYDDEGGEFECVKCKAKLTKKGLTPPNLHFTEQFLKIIKND